MLSKEDYARKLSSIRAQINGRGVVIVSKNRSLQEILAYYELGQRDFGENKVQELAQKSQQLHSICPDIRWHMIGHLQSNKINQLLAVPGLWAIHSIDSVELMEKLLKAADRLSSEVRVFLQFKTAQDEEKFGFQDYPSLLSAAQLIHPPFVLQGLMAMGGLGAENFENEARRCFQDLMRLKKRLETELEVKLQTSMGMSQDYTIALEEGSDWIRLGTMMFT
jgi:PLP dependent protein